MRKILSLVLVLAMVLSSFAFAAVDVNTVGQELKDLGVLKGDNAGNLNPDQNLTREQALVVLARLMGKEDEAAATTVKSSFADVPTDSYYAPYVAYAELNGWTNGKAVGVFGYMEDATMAMMATYHVRALGYTVTTLEEGVAKATELKILTDVTAAAGATITRGEVFVMMNNTLNTPKMGETQALVYALGLKTVPAPTVVEVKSVTATNLKQLVVNFTGVVESAGDEDNYTLTTDGTAVLDADSDFALAEDGMSVTITLTTAAEQQDLVDLEIEGVVEDDTTIEDIEFLDMTIPTATSAEVVGIDTIKVFFSEPMNAGIETAANYVVKDADGDKLYVKSVVAGTNNMSANVEIFADLSGDVTVEVSGVKDYQGYTAPKATLAVTVVVDETAPTVVGFKDAEPNNVTLIFDNEIEVAGYDADAADPDANVDLENFYHTNTSNIASAVELDGNELTLTFSDDNKMPVGTVYTYVAADSVNDLWDNDNDKIATTITVVVDEIAPVVVGDVDVTGQSTAEVTYSEDIVKGDDFELTVLENGKESDVTATATIDDEVLEITFSEDIYGDFQIVIEDVEDVQGNEAAKATLDFTVEDETAPDEEDFTATIYDADEADQLVVVDFGEEMNADDIANKALYFFGDTTLDDDDVTITIINDGEAVEIEIPASVADVDALDILTIGRVRDAAGNKLETLTATVELIDGDEPTLDATVEQTAVDTITVTVDGEELVDIDVNAITFQAAGSDLGIAKVKTGLNSDGETVITYTLSEDLTTDVKTTSGAAVVTYSIDVDAGSNKYGQDLATTAGAVVADACAPEVDTILYDTDSEGTTIVITFTEDLDAAYFADAGKNGFSVSGGTLTSALRTGTNEVTLTGEDFTVNTNVSYNGTSGLVDSADNDLEAFTITDALD
ncbi:MULTISPECIES: S-layer homology domain-containing protein [unclassified Fusibacter]|uniref:S-layer homology domain-containing protein n=1 Tax=unclassified Fusibacter TaxID=2624464 RepID=UPI001012937E|nr:MULTISPECIES: S-layer homology domain-containing protein [unclassified Fusibacter]MCK8061242.1 S-layer homology domain-containing protein [Fusibacter sp. A2]NPE23414.1 S-layer homology domain-containing protein [Fusibacter sp. A1]RXV59193.1 S-layer homology domain-containing protein [Fusibacter sp. A1]